MGTRGVEQGIRIPRPRPGRHLLEDHQDGRLLQCADGAADAVRILGKPGGRARGAQGHGVRRAAHVLTRTMDSPLAASKLWTGVYLLHAHADSMYNTCMRTRLLVISDFCY